MGLKKGRKRESLWQADFGSVLVLVLFVLILFGVDSWVKPTFTSLTLLTTGFVLALVPAIVWLAFFYRRDRLEPEPKKLVIQVFLLGALLANAIGVPLREDLFKVQDWLYISPPWSIILGSVLVVGFIQEFLKYAAVRYTVYHSEEFDEPTDGIIYATAAGLGFATVLNIAFVVNSGGVHLGYGSIRIVITALAHASFAGVTGYFLSKQKFSGRPVWWMPLGVTVAALLNGLFFYLRGAVVQGATNLSGGLASQWYGLILAAALALIMTWLLSKSIQRELDQASGSKES